MVWAFDLAKATDGHFQSSILPTAVLLFLRYLFKFGILIELVIGIVGSPSYYHSIFVIDFF